MKFRVHGNSIRFRLNRREVEVVRANGHISAIVEFPGGGTLIYSLSSGGAEMGASFEAGEIRVSVPSEVANEWTGTDQVAILERVPVSGGRDLEILIEKDFQCMHKGEEGKDPDAYPNPMVRPED